MGLTDDQMLSPRSAWPHARIIGLGFGVGWSRMALVRARRAAQRHASAARAASGSEACSQHTQFNLKDNEALLTSLAWSFKVTGECRL
eukprot:748297-Rhodomonas_salina.5